MQLIHPNTAMVVLLKIVCLGFYIHVHVVNLEHEQQFSPSMLLHLLGCGCDVGGAFNQLCDTLSGQCKCRANVTGRDCSRYEFGIHHIQLFTVLFLYVRPPEIFYKMCNLATCFGIFTQC